MDSGQPTPRADKEQAARDFVRSVLVTTFKQTVDEETVRGVAKKVQAELAASPYPGKPAA